MIDVKDKEAVLAKITEVLVNLFELEEADITPESRLYDDLDIDSIDAVDLVVELKKITGKKIKPEDFKNVRTVADIVTSIEQLADE